MVVEVVDVEVVEVLEVDVVEVLVVVVVLIVTGTPTRDILVVPVMVDGTNRTRPGDGVVGPTSP